jgi:uncharacterized protein (TIGR00255 family)
MIYSMTGFGRGEASTVGIYVSAEVRTLNNRYFDFSMRSSRSLMNFENELREFCRSQISRGKIMLTLTETRGPDSAVTTEIDEMAAGRLAAQLSELAIRLGIDDKVKLAHLLQFPELIIPVENAGVNDQLLSLCTEATRAALEDLCRMREAEGRELAKDMLERVTEIETALDEVVKHQEHLPARALEKLRERVKKLTLPEAYDNGRLEMELALLADRLDITEECVRLKGHIGAFRKTIESPTGTVGKRLGFLLQEMNREANTISSKTSSLDISHLSVRMREEIERIREQVQNLE